jgi:hypothetical protein
VQLRDAGQIMKQDRSGLRRSSAAGTVHCFNDSFERRTTGTQPALSLRLGPKIQTLLPRERRPTGSRRTGQSRSRSGCSIVRGGRGTSRTSTKAPDAPALEDDHLSWLRPSDADATEGRRQLSVVRYGARSSVSRRVSVSPPTWIDPGAGPNMSRPFSNLKNRFCSVPT